MNPSSYIDGLTEKNRMLSQKNTELVTLSESKAQLERAYNIANAEATLQLKQEGHPVSMLPQLVKGDKKVADAKYAHDVKEGVYRACLESIKDLRTQIDTYRSLLTWLREEKRG